MNPDSVYIIKDHRKVHCLKYNTGNANNAIILVHGAMSHSECFLDCMKNLQNEFQIVLAMDVPGFGKTHWKVPKHENMISDMIDAIELVVDDTKCENVSLVGHSFGSFLAAKYALKNPTKIKNLVLVSPVGLMKTPRNHCHTFFWAVVFKKVVPYLYPGKESWGNSKAIGHLLNICWLHRTATWTDPVGEALKTLSAGLCITCIYAKEDYIVPVDTSLSEKEAVVIEGAGHVSLLYDKYAALLCDKLVTICRQ
jgi:pimeloyl-ACP methyl ester carboxylesterase